MREPIAILGGSGVYARHLIPRLVAAGYPVRALVRRPEAAVVARECGAEVRVADIFQGDVMTAALEGCAVGVNLATSLPGPSGRGDFAANDQLRREGTPVWLEACRRAGVGRVVQQSIAMVNAVDGDGWADEETPFGGDGEGIAGKAIQAALAMEAAVRESGLDALVLRGGLFYGPGTGFDDDWFARARAGTLRVPGDGRGFVSLVHVADMAVATVAAIARWPAAGALIVADDRPVQWGELFAYVAALAGAGAVPAGGRLGFPSFRVRNARAREALGWAPAYPDHRAGLAR